MTEPIMLAQRFTDYVNAQDVKGVLSVTGHNVELISPGKSAAGYKTRRAGRIPHLPLF